MYFFRCAIIYNLCFLLVNLCAGLEPLNHSMAKSHCESNEGLFNHTNLTKNGYLLLNMFGSDTVEGKNSVLLKEGESAWISGYVKYSRFISWKGCYKEMLSHNSYIKYRITETTITACIAVCEERVRTSEYMYIGIYTDKCYCFENIKDIISTIGDANCTRQYPYNINFNSTGSKNKSIHVYSVFKDISKDLENNSRQCVVATNTSTRPVTMESSSCYTRTGQATGVICINAVRGKLNKSCHTYFDQNEKSPAFCLENNKTSWSEADERCNALSGIMLDVDLFPKFKTRNSSLLDKYWMGIYRSFEVVPEEGKTCLAVTKYLDKLIVDPDDCSVKKKVLCNLRLEPMSSNTTIKTIIPSKTNKDNKDSSTTTGTMTTTTSKSNKANAIHVGIFVTIASLIVIIIVLAIILLVKKVRKKHVHQHLQSHSQLASNDSQSTPSAHNFTSKIRNDCTDIQPQNCRANKITTEKPDRQTLKKHNKTSFYENSEVKLEASSAGAENSTGKMDEDYDRLDLNRKSERPNVNQDNDESHVYAHTTHSENYDTFQSTKSRSQYDCVVYSTVQKKRNREDTENISGGKYEDDNAYDISTVK